MDYLLGNSGHLLFACAHVIFSVFLSPPRVAFLPLFFSYLFSCLIFSRRLVWNCCVSVEWKCRILAFWICASLVEMGVFSRVFGSVVSVADCNEGGGVEKFVYFAASVVNWGLVSSNKGVVICWEIWV